MIALISHDEQYGRSSPAAAAAWLLVRVYENPAADLETLCEQFDIPASVGAGVLAELEQRRDRVPDRGAEGLARACEHRAPDLHPDLVDVARNLACELAGEPTCELAGQTA